MSQFAKFPEHRKLRDPEYASGRCEEVTEELTRYLRANGWSKKKAYSLGTDGEITSPDGFNYRDRQIKGINAHACTLLDLNSLVFGSSLLIDFTASQYGYREFPFIQLLTPNGRWLRGEAIAAYIRGMSKDNSYYEYLLKDY